MLHLSNAKFLLEMAINVVKTQRGFHAPRLMVTHTEVQSPPGTSRFPSRCV